MKRKPIEERIRFLREYRWSSYPGYIGKRKALDYVEYGPILAMMRGKKSMEGKRYRQYVETGMAEDDVDFMTALRESPRSIGSDGFRAWIDELYQELVEGRGVPEDISFRHVTEPLAPDTVLGILAKVLGVDVEEFRARRRNSPLRAIAARYLIRYAGQSQRDVARLLNAGSGSAISKQLNRYSEALTKDRKLDKLLRAVERTLKRERARCKKVINS